MGHLRPGKILLDATSGNTGIAYAMLGAAEGFPVTLCMPENVSRERKQILQGYGANIIYTDPGDGSDGAIHMARSLAEKHPDQYFYADQYSNDANWKAHYCMTANEIWQQTQGRVTHFVSMLGTSGTFVGTALRDHGAGDLPRDRWPGDAFRRRHGNQRHLRRYGAPPERA
jgi:cysteine synthase B